MSISNSIIPQSAKDAIQSMFPNIDLPSWVEEHRGMVDEGGTMKCFVGSSRAVHGWSYLGLENGRYFRTNRTLCVVERSDGRLDVTEAC